MRRRVLAIFLSLCMIVGFFPIQVLAASESYSLGDVDKSGAISVNDLAQIELYVSGSFQPENDALFRLAADMNLDGEVGQQDIDVVKRIIISSEESRGHYGSCGESVYWRLIDGVLTICGTGAMEDYLDPQNYFHSQKFPWYSFKDTIVSASISDGVTNIGVSAFSDCANMASVSIASSVRIIGSFAFCTCSSLTNVTIPNGVTSIGSYTFYCSGLKNVSIPNSVTSIGNQAFYGCSSLTAVTIPTSVRSIGDFAFAGCGLTSVIIPNSVTSIEDNTFQGCRSLKSVTIPSSVTRIGEWAFESCTSLKSVIIPDSVTSIGNNAFKWCTGLTNVTIPGSVVSIGDSAFRFCENLVNAIISNGVANIGDYTFVGCSRLTNVILPNSVANIGVHAFLGCSSLTNVLLPDGVTRIETRMFSGCSRLTDITIPNSITSIEAAAFEGCSGLTDVFYNGTQAQWQAVRIGTDNEPLIHANIHFKLPQTYTVTFDANGGAVNTRTKTVSNGSTYGDLPIPVRDTYAFEGWYTQAADGQQITSETMVNLSANQTLYAHWRPRIVSTYFITYSPNGGEWSGGVLQTYQQKIYDQPLTLNSSALRRTGYTFAGWSASPTGDVEYRNGDLYTKNESLDLYAVWTPLTFSVAFNPNGGTVATAAKTVTYGSAYGDLPTPVRANYTFEGWYTQAGGGQEITGQTMVSLSADQTLYARWTAAPVPGYDVTKDAYSFANQKSSFGYTSTSAGENYPIPYESVRCLFGDSIKGKYVYKNMIRYPWNGNCCGMAATSALMYDGTVVTEQGFGSNTVSGLRISQTNSALDNLDVKTFIEAMQTAQYADGFSKVYKGNQLYQIHLKNGSTLNGLYEAVREDVGNRQATLIAIGKDGVGAHALLAYGVEENGTETTLGIYDCNHPMESRRMTLRSSGGEATEWSYDMGGSYGVWGSDDPYCFISYVPYSVMETIWKNRGNPNGNCELLTVNSGNVSIRNFAGEVVAELKDGKLITDAEDVYEVPGLTMTETAATAIYLPKDCYTVTNTAEDLDEFEASMVDVHYGAAIQTSASTVTFAVADQENSNLVTIEDVTSLDTYRVSLDCSVKLSGLVPPQNVTVSGKGNSTAASSISIAASGRDINISGECVIGSLLVNGEERVRHIITALAGEGGRISPAGDCEVAAGGTAAFKVIPDAGYIIEEILLDGKRIGTDPNVRLPDVHADHVIKAQFKKGDYSIANARLDGNTLTAEVKTSGSATLIGAVYSRDGKLLVSRTKALAQSGTAALRFDGFVPPEACKCKLFLVDAYQRPVCAPCPVK